MPGKNASKGKGRPGLDDPMDHDRGDADMAIATPDTDRSEPRRGRSASSPGHLKKAAGAQSAREFAPGREARMDRGEVEPDGAGRKAR